MKDVEMLKYVEGVNLRNKLYKIFEIQRIFGRMISITSGQLPYLHFKHLKEITVKELK
jgi:hypothetical protein